MQQAASGLVEAGVDASRSEKLGAKFDGDSWPTFWRACIFGGRERLTREIEASTDLSRMVRAIKEYTTWIKAPEQEVDVHRVSRARSRC